MNATSKACDRGTGEAVHPFRATMVATSASTSPGLVKRLGPGVITGAADDDPSGIATYSQAVAQAGFGLVWTVVLTWPLMVAVLLLFLANTIDIGADPSATGAAAIAMFVLMGR